MKILAQLARVRYPMCPLSGGNAMRDAKAADRPRDNPTGPIALRGAAASPAADAGERITALLHRIVARVSASANEEFRPFGFNVQGARVLISLLDAGPTRVGDLGRALAIDLSTLSHLLRRFSRDELLVRSRVDADNRSVSVMLTPRGRQVAQKCKMARVRHESLLLKGFAAAEIEAARNLLRRVCANVEGPPLDPVTRKPARKAIGAGSPPRNANGAASPRRRS